MVLIGFARWLLVLLGVARCCYGVAIVLLWCC